MGDLDGRLRQLRRREIPTFDLSKSVALWGNDTVSANPRKVSWPKPDVPVFGFTIPQLDSLPDYMQVQRGGGVQIDSVKVTFGQDVLFLQDLAVLALIRQNLGKRAIYFSWSDGGYPDQTFGLEPYLVSQGMVRKLLPNKVVANDSMVSNPILGMVDLPRTNELLWNAYHWKAIARSRPRGWVDPPSSSILQLYAVIYRGMAETYRAQGNMKLAIEADRISQEIRTNLQPIQ